MNKDHVEVYFILDLNDLSGKPKNEFIAQFNSFVNKQKNKEVNTYLTTIVLENGYKILHSRNDVKHIEELKNMERMHGYDVSIDDAICITLSKAMLLKSSNRLETDASKSFFIVLTNNFDSKNTLFSEGEVKEFIGYFKQTLRWEFFTFGISEGVKDYSNRLGISNSLVLKTTMTNGLSDSDNEFFIEVPTFLRQARNKMKNTTL